MNANTASATQRGGSTRGVGIVLILVIAAMAGIAVGTLIQQSGDDRSATGAEVSGATYYWPDEPLNHHTPSFFGATYFWPDEPLSHHTPSSFERVPADWPDYGLRIRVGAAAESSDTFRLTGPSQLQGSNANQGEDEPVHLRRQPN